MLGLTLFYPISELNKEILANGSSSIIKF